MYFSMIKDSHGDFNSNPFALESSDLTIKKNRFSGTHEIRRAMQCSAQLEAAERAERLPSSDAPRRKLTLLLVGLAGTQLALLKIF